MTIGQKLYSGFGAALLITMILGVVSTHSLNDLGNGMDRISKVKTRNLYLTSDINKMTADILSLSRGMNLRGHMNDLETVRKYHETMLSEADRVKTEGAEFVGRTLYPDLKDKMQRQILNKTDNVMQGINADYAFIMSGNMTAADTFYKTSVLPVAFAVGAAGDEIAEFETQDIAKYADDASATVPPARNLNIAMILLAMCVGAFGIWIVRGINKVLQSSIVELSDGAEQVATAAEQVSSSSQSLAQGASQQAASLEETSASSEEINAMARKNTDNSRATAELLLRSEEKITLANRYLKDMVVSMELITESSGKISKIIKVIDEIAFQTNILALNAAVEAARAGEAGMGFAVVADEVRSLAERSAQAAKDTTTLIEDSITRSSEGKIKVDQVALAIRAVTEDSAKVKVMVDEVSLGSDEQSRGIDQIARAIGQMEQVTQTNAASAEESAAAAEELSAQSEALKDIIGRLHNMVGGDVHIRVLRSSSHRTAPLSSQAYRFSAPQRKKNVVISGKPAHLPNVADPQFTKATATELDSFPMEDSFRSF